MIIGDIALRFTVSSIGHVELLMTEYVLSSIASVYFLITFIVLIAYRKKLELPRNRKRFGNLYEDIKTWKGGYLYYSAFLLRRALFVTNANKLFSLSGL